MDPKKYFDTLLLCLPVAVVFCSHGYTFIFSSNGTSLYLLYDCNCKVFFGVLDLEIALLSNVNEHTWEYGKAINHLAQIL